MTRRLHDLLLWLSAADRDVLSRAPEGERTRFVAAGGAVLATIGMAALAGSFTFSELMHVPLAFAIALGVGFALLIMNLERYVQASLRRQSHWALTLLSAAPRVALSYFMGMVITIPLMLAVFASDIDKQITRDRNAALRSARVALDQQFAEINDLEREQRTLQRRLHTIQPGVVLTTSPVYARFTRRILRLQRWVRTTPDPRLVHQYQRRIRVLEPRIKELREELLAQERVEADGARVELRIRLDEVRRRLTALQEERDVRDAELSERFSGPAGLAAHVTALERVSDDQPGVGLVKNVLVIFLIAVDSLPAVLLALLLVGRKSAFERMQDAEEDAATETAEELATLRRAAAAAGAKARLEAERLITDMRLKTQVQLQREMDQIFIDSTGERLRPATERLAREAAELYVRRLEAEDRASRNRESRTPVAPSPLPGSHPSLSWRTVRDRLVGRLVLALERRPRG